MPRIARLVLPGSAHHVTQRGNNRQDVFFTSNDRRLYLTILREQARKYAVTIQAYCLMTNHVHLVVKPSDSRGLALAIGRTHWRYTIAINRLHGRSGHLWQNRFFSCPMSEEYELLAIRYVEQNPVRARMLRAAWRYPWSSAAAHCGVAADASGVLDGRSAARRFAPEEWKAMLRASPEENEVERIRSCLWNGRPLASDRWIARLEARLGRRLRSAPPGRPRKLLRGGEGGQSRSTRRKPVTVPK